MRLINAVKQWKVVVGILTLMAFGGNAEAGRLFVNFYGNLGPGTGSPIQGTSIEDLTSAPDFPDSPGVVSGDDLGGAGGLTFPFLNNGLEWPPDFETGNFSDNYGMMVEGYLYVPQSGEWKLFVRSDDASQLEFNPNGADPEGAEIVAEEPGCCNAFMDDGTRSSDLMTLETGTAYYFRILHKEGQGGDWFQVGWDGPGVNGPRVIRAPFVQEFADDGELEITVPPESVTVTERQDATFEVGVRGIPPFTFEWTLDGEPIAGANNPFVTLEDLSLERNGATVAVTVSSGGDSVTGDATLNVEPDSVAPFVRHADTRGNPNGVTVTFSEGVSDATAVDAGNYSIDGGSISIDSVERLSENQVRLNIAGDGFAELSSHTIEIREVEDLAADANVIDPNPTTLEFQFGGGDLPFYPEAVLADGPIRYWRLDERSGNIALSEVGDEDTAGPVNGSPTLGVDSLTPSVPGNKAMRFTASQHLGDLDASDINQGDGPWAQRTLQMWIQPDRITEDAQLLWEEGGGSRGTSLYLQGNQIFFNVWNNNDDGPGSPYGSGSDSGPVFVGGGDIQVGDVVHVVAVMEGIDSDDLTGTLRLYLNGELVDETEGVGLLYNHAADVDLGGDPGGQIHSDANEVGFEGAIDEVAIYNAALSAERVKTHYDAATIRSEVGPIEITQEPQDVTLSENLTAEFSVEVSGARPHNIQWEVNGEPVDGATEATFTIERVKADMSGNTITAKVSNEFSEAVTQDATLTVEADTAPPEIVSIEALAGGLDEIRIEFDEVLDEASATDTGNYSIEGLSISSATLSENGTTVTLQTGDQTLDEELTLSIQNVTDIAAAENAFSGEVMVTPDISYSIEVLADGPIRYWRLGETSGSTAASEVGTELTPKALASGSYDGNFELGVASLLPAVQDNTAVRFGGNAAVDGLDANDINEGGGNGPWDKRTVEFWFSMDELPPAGEARYVFEEGGGVRSLQLYVMGTEEGAELVLYGYNEPSDGAGAPWSGQGDNAIFVTHPVTAGNTFHVVGMMDGDASNDFEGQLRLFVNGEEVATADGVGQLYPHAGDVDIAEPDSQTHIADLNSTGFVGVIDEFALYNKALNPDRVRAHFNAAFAGVGEPGPAEVTKAPESKTVPENSEVQFTVEFSGTPPLEVTWFKNEEEIESATGLIEISNTVSFQATAADDDATIRAEVSNAEGSDTSAEASLTVELDETPPQVVSIQGAAGGANTIEVTFDEPVTEATATDLTNYSVEGLSIESAELSADGKTVTLTTGDQTAGQELTLSIDGVQDRAAAGNTITAEQSFTSQLFYPAEVLADSPVRFWRLNESEGDVAVSQALGTASQADANASYVGAKLDVEGLAGKPEDTAVALKAEEGDHIPVPGHVDIDTDEPYTEKAIELWFKPDELPTEGEVQVLYEQGGAWRGISIYLVGSQPESPTEADLVFHAWNDPPDAQDGPTGMWGVGPGGNDEPRFVQTTIQAGGVYQAVLVMEGDDSGDNNGTLRGFVNGAEVGSEEGIGQLFSHANPNAIGGVNGGTSLHSDDLPAPGFFDGIVDEASHYNTVVDAEGVQQHFEAGVAQKVNFGPAEITQGPESKSAPENQAVTFSAQFNGTPPFDVTWRKSGEVIQQLSTAAASHTLSFVARAGDDDAGITVEVSNGEGADSSGEATLSVEADTEPPQLVRVQGLAGTTDQILLTFNEPLDEASATNTANYTVEGLTIESASLSADGKTVILTTSDQEVGGEFTVNVETVADVAAAANTVSTQHSFTASPLAAYWSFDEGEGTTAEELAGGNNGSLEGGTAWTDDTPSLGDSNPAALSFDGVDDFVLTPFPGIGGDLPRSVSFWVKTTDTSTHGIVAWGNDTEDGAKYHIRVNNSTGTIRTEVQGGNNWGSTEIIDNQWHHVVSVVPDVEDPNNSDVIHYVDGERDPQLGGSPQDIDTDITSGRALPVTIGRRTQGSSQNQFAGMIDDVAIFNTALTAEQVAQLAEGTSPLALFGQAKPKPGPELSISLEAGEVTLTWETDATLQTATSVNGPWNDSDKTSPANFTVEGEAMYFRLVE